ncbi:MAG: hypothetical protein FJZ47_07685 [Candidatus Tectomicrobia bacterium]|uniref:Lipoprotein n=1 Tax=Tectimicrobiota bacterium TaxID=2528274 RepID=A0A938B3C7_UNCTE|nr:hypothetical protein [Candidatus Tectomicrobia bacterium]
MTRAQLGRYTTAPGAIALGTVLLLAQVLAGTGCTLGSSGTLVARYTYTDTAVVLDRYMLGAQLRLQGPDGGATLGYRRASYVFARTGAPSNPPPVVWRYFHAPWPAGRLLLRGTTTIGLECQMTSEVHRLTLGYLDQLVTAGPAPDVSQVVHIFYQRHQPHLGYDRQTTAFVPKVQTTDPQHPQEPVKEAMSVIATTNIAVRWFRVQQIAERFATGPAAINLAKNPDAIRQFEAQ